MSERIMLKKTDGTTEQLKGDGSGRALVVEASAATMVHVHTPAATAPSSLSGVNNVTITIPAGTKVAGLQNCLWDAAKATYRLLIRVSQAPGLAATAMSTAEVVLNAFDAAAFDLDPAVAHYAYATLVDSGGTAQTGGANDYVGQVLEV
jgi:hypothetical protein